MADIPCPNCGKSNPPELDLCKYCQEPLKPLDGSQTSSNTPFGEQTGQEQEIPDWLKGLRGFDEGGSGEALPSESTPDWLQGAASSELGEVQPGEESDLPDWLSRMGGQEELKTETGVETTPSPVSESLSDWQAEAKDSDIPDWFPKENLDAGSNFNTAISEQPSPAAQPAGENELPDWLSQLKSSQDFEEPQKADRIEPIQEEVPATPFQSNTDMPDWLSNLTAQEPPKEEISTQEEPDWLKGMRDQTAAQQPAAATPAFDESSLSATGGDEALPDWLKKLDTGDSDKTAIGVPALILGDETPAPFSSNTGANDFKGAEELTSEPEWLSQVSAEQEATPESNKNQEAEQPSDLAKATLPGWLEAMRPLESAAPATPYVDTSDDRVEGAGPLAGLRGVLSAEPDVAQVRKPALYSIKLQVPTDQQSRLDMLQKLVETENEAKPLPSPAAVSISSIVRLVLFVLFVLAVIWALSGTQQMPLPGAPSVPNEITAFHTAVETLPANAQVLLGFDYEPGFSGELEASVSAVLNRLDQKGASLVVVSTNTNGPYLAERMIQQLNSQTDSSVKAPVSYINLGYIPGGATGLQAFANAPSQVMRYDLKNGASPWNGNPLDFQKEMQNFSMVIVITENADTARAWVEQVGPSLRSTTGNIPLLMVISAQAEPMVRPYYEGASQQVAGILPGLRAGAIYENLIGQNNGTARQYWDAYSLTILVSVFLIVIGACVSGILAALAKTRHSKVEGKA